MTASGQIYQGRSCYMDSYFMKACSKTSCTIMRQATSYDLQQLDKSVKKSTGSFYTPEFLANLISREALFAWLSTRVDRSIRHSRDFGHFEPEQRKSLLSALGEIKILDPSVGEGVFLLAAAELITKIRVELGDTEREKQRRHKILTENLFGVDLDNNAIESCRTRLQEWGKASLESDDWNIRYGNSLVGELHDQSSIKREYDSQSFHWKKEFAQVFSDNGQGFSIVIGNPPYGSILSMNDRRFISNCYNYNVGDNRTGTWNSASHFIVRSMDLLEDTGQLGFLIPNSILRVKQFTKTREFLLNSTNLWKIVDEGSPFGDVTLEMVSIFCSKNSANPNQEILVESRRPGLVQPNRVPLSVLKSSGIFPIYYDHIFSKILERGKKHLLVAVRGRDIPKEHTMKEAGSQFIIPYITSGRSVRRYHIDPRYLVYTDNWLHQDSALKESFENEFLVATKNYRYPRCVLKPKGVAHGGGIVRITPRYANANLRVLGLILNSKLVRQICIRYLTNYSQLTCCLNTGIMEELPIVLPDKPLSYSILFDSLTSLYSEQEGFHSQTRTMLEHLSDTLVYALYFHDSDSLEKLVDDRVSDMKYETISPENLCKVLGDSEILNAIDEILESPAVKEIELLGNFPPSKKSLRY